MRSARFSTRSRSGRCLQRLEGFTATHHHSLMQRYTRAMPASSAAMPNAVPASAHPISRWSLPYLNGELVERLEEIPGMDRLGEVADKGSGQSQPNEAFDNTAEDCRSLDE
jgi:hypothetical protein